MGPQSGMVRDLSLLLAILLATLPARASEPSLPAGLGGGGGGISAQETAPAPSQQPWADFSGFIEGRAGTRYADSPYHKDPSLLETRAQFQFDRSFDLFHARLTTDLLLDAIDSDHSIDLEKGEGFIDLREAFIITRPADAIDVKAGRQILTWGTGDLVFLNDLFPKDWVSFFVGRDEEYLKAPSDALKLSFFTKAASLDVVYTPQFDPDRYLTGERISFYNENLGRITGENNRISADRRESWFSEDELSLRLYRTFGAYETALYGYSGYWKSPAGQTTDGMATFPALSVYGASVRGPALKGIANAEASYYDSRDDDHGTNPLIRNSELRFLTGYEQELFPNFTASAQYYLERMMDYDEYRENLPAGMVQKDKNRHMLTLRLTKLMMNQNLELSLFNFWSPSDADGYLRPKATYKLDDHWTASIGANVFYGQRRDTFWGQFEDNSNIWASIRYGF